MSFKNLELTFPILKALNECGYTAPTPIQAQSIPKVLAGGDLIASAQTGTGKTAAFVLPGLQRLSAPCPGRKRGPRALVLTPTRELAEQITESVRVYGKYLRVKSTCIVGGMPYPEQLRALRKSPDLVIATPGRLLDHLERGRIDLSCLELLVLDEADRMLDMGFVNDVRRIVGGLPKKRQTLLFSATISPEVKTLVADMLKSPKVIQIGRPRNPIETITQHIYAVEKALKMDLLLHMIEDWRMFSVLVFSRTKYGADKISRRLKRAGVVAVSIHSGRTQSQRQKALDGFRSGKYQVMVATDIAARGIDVEGISHVINYDVPTHAEDYVHRIGRTGRAAATGDAITFVSSEEKKYLREVGKFIGRKLTTQKCKGFSYVKSPPSQPKTDKSSKPSRRNQPPGSKRASRAKKSYRGRRKHPKK